MRIAYLSSEVLPFSKTGGLADVAGALPEALAAAGHEVVVLTPYHRSVRESGHAAGAVGVSLTVPVGRDGEYVIASVRRLEGAGASYWFIEHEPSFDRAGLYGEDGKDYEDNCARFALFCRAALRSLEAAGFRPDVLHCNDWQSALALVHLTAERESGTFFGSTRSLMTVHNLGYQGLFPAEEMPETGLPDARFNLGELEFHGKVNLLKGGLVHADGLSTVSRRYSEEIQTKEYGAGLEGVLQGRSKVLTGIPNGVDVRAWNPATDPHLAANYGPDDLSGKAKCKSALQAEARLPLRGDHMLLGLVGRLAEQKGIDLITDRLPEILARPVQLVILGTGSPECEEDLRLAAEAHPDRIRTWIRFDEGLAHRIEAGADAFLMPSRYEPCGLNQMYSMRYGTVPIVRATGGLADTVTDATPAALADGTATGFRFDKAEPDALLATMDRALALYADPEGWRGLLASGMAADFSWDARAREYEDLYDRIGRIPV